MQIKIFCSFLLEDHIPVRNKILFIERFKKKIKQKKNVILSTTCTSTANLLPKFEYLKSKDIFKLHISSEHTCIHQSLTDLPAKFPHDISH